MFFFNIDTTKDSNKNNLFLTCKKLKKKSNGSNNIVHLSSKYPFQYKFKKLLVGRNNNIDDDEIDNITLTDEQYQDNIQHITGIETCCPICMETSTKDELMAKTTCGHVFHDHCLHKWLTQECSQPTCPMCRHEFY